MSQQKITIALIGDPEAASLLENMVLDFSEHYRDSNAPLDSSITPAPPYVLKIFHLSVIKLIFLKSLMKGHFK